MLWLKQEMNCKIFWLTKKRSKSKRQEHLISSQNIKMLIWKDTVKLIAEGQKNWSIDVVEYLQVFYNISLIMPAWRQIIE